MTEPTAPQAPVWSPSPSDAPLAPPAPPTPQAPGPVAVQAKARGGSLLTWLLAGALLVAAAGIAFAVGRVTAPAQAAAFRGGLAGGNGQGALPGTANNGQGFRAALGSGGLTVRGTVTAVNGQTLTLQLAGGQTVTVNLSGSTTYHKATTGSASDVTNGSTVEVQVQGFQRGANASPSPGTTQLSASDVTVVTP